ncbi:hypothetical protein [Maribacter sp. Asnod2-G09]|uniref:hypothetical protein n=1 Tax=Maribacter sp. Asnod2-G09 TaxID=3160577 RepID=UPI00386EF4E2
MRNLLYLTITLFILTSCSSDDVINDTTNEITDNTTDSSTDDTANDSDNDMTPVSYDKLVVTTTISKIGLDEATIKLSTNQTLPINATETILYRENGQEAFIETNNEVIVNLTSGKKHEVKTRVTINGNSYESGLQTFITKGYLASSQVFAEVDILNKKFDMIFAYGVESGFTQPFVGYVKVGNDSVPAENIIYENNKISFDINEETQIFFENDTEYIPNKSFTLGLFSGDYYQHFVPYQEDINYDGDITSRWNFFNKKPFLKSYNNTEYSSCLGTDNRKGLLDIRGKFWGFRSADASNPGVANIPDNLTIRLTNLNDASIEKVYTTADFTESSNVYFECDVEKFNLLREIIGGQYEGFHSDNYLRLRFNKDFITPGDYKITYAVEKDNVVYISDELTVVLE